MTNLKRYGNWAGEPKGKLEDTTRCIIEVFDNFTMRSHQCFRKRGHGKEQAYCIQHAKKNGGL